MKRTRNLTDQSPALRDRETLRKASQNTPNGHGIGAGQDFRSTVRIYTGEVNGGCGRGAATRGLYL